MSPRPISSTAGFNMYNGSELGGYNTESTTYSHAPVPNSILRNPMPSYPNEGGGGGGRDGEGNLMHHSPYGILHHSQPNQHHILSSSSEHQPEIMANQQYNQVPCYTSCPFPPLHPVSLDPKAEGDTSIPPYLFQLGVDGWKRGFLYGLICLIALLVLINSALIIWILRTINLTTRGLGKLEVKDDGLVSLPGTNIFLQESVTASSISSLVDKELRMFSTAGFQWETLNRTSSLSNSSFHSQASRFVIRDPWGKLQFKADAESCVFAANRLKVSGKQGIKLNSSIQAPIIKYEPRYQQMNLMKDQNSFPDGEYPFPEEELRIESSSKRISILGPKAVNLLSIHDKVAIEALEDVRFTTRKHAIHMNGTQLYMENLQVVIPTKRGHTYPNIYQLCLCPSSGRFFALNPQVQCKDHLSYCHA